MKQQQIQALIFVMILLVGTLTLERPISLGGIKPLSIILPEDHRAYEWEWTVKFVYAQIGTSRDTIKSTIKNEIMEKLTNEVDEKGKPIQVIGEPEIVHMKVVKSYYVMGNVVAYDYEITTRTRFHGYFSKPEVPLVVEPVSATIVAMAVVTLIAKVAPLIILGIIAILVLDKICTLAIVVRDITTDYVSEEEYAVDDEGNLILDDEGNPIVIRTFTSRTSTVSNWMPWIFNIVLVLSIALVVAFVAPSFIGGRKKRGR